MRTDCHDIRQTFGLLLAGELTGDESTRVEIHLASCEDCRRLHGRFRRLDALLAAAPVPSLSRDEVKLMALRAGEASRRSGSRRRILQAAAVMATLLIPAASYFTFTPHAPSRPLAIDPFGTADLEF